MVKSISFTNDELEAILSSLEYADYYTPTHDSARRKVQKALGRKMK